MATTELFQATQAPLLKTWTITRLNPDQQPKKGSLILTRNQICTNPNGECRLYGHLLYPQAHYTCSHCLSAENHPTGKFGDILLAILVTIAMAMITLH